MSLQSLQEGESVQIYKHTRCLSALVIGKRTEPCSYTVATPSGNVYRKGTLEKEYSSTPPESAIMPDRGISRQISVDALVPPRRKVSSHHFMWGSRGTPEFLGILPTTGHQLQGGQHYLQRQVGSVSGLTWKQWILHLHMISGLCAAYPTWSRQVVCKDYVQAANSPITYQPCMPTAQGAASPMR